MFNKEQLQVMCNIIAAVESEGQVYHTREKSTGYGAFTEAYKNSSAETAITLGRYQHYGVEAQKLLELIYSKDKSLFTQELISDINNLDWNYYNIKRNSSKAKTIIAIISSDIGKECQDELVGEQMQQFAKEAENLGVTDVWAQAMCANYRHQGGYGALTRIVAKTRKPYNLNNIYNASKTDTGNQVGVYKQRQTCVYNFIKKYMKIEDTSVDNTEKDTTPMYEITPGTTADDIINIMRNWLGLSIYNGTHKPIIDIYNSYLPHPRGYAVSYNDDFCDACLSASFIQANAVDLIGGIECGVEEHVKIFQKKGIWIEDETITPQKGDIICFNWGGATPNTGWSDHIGIVEYVENNIIHTIEGNSGGVVARRKYPVGYSEIRGFARPKYGSNGSTVKVETKPAAESKPSSSNGAINKTPQFQGKVTADILNVRTWAGTENPNIKSYPQLVYGNTVEVCDTVKDSDGDSWYYVRINKKIFGFVSADYIQKI